MSRYYYTEVAVPVRFIDSDIVQDIAEALWVMDYVVRDIIRKAGPDGIFVYKDSHDLLSNLQAVLMKSGIPCDMYSEAEAGECIEKRLTCYRPSCKAGGMGFKKVFSSFELMGSLSSPFEIYSTRQGVYMPTTFATDKFAAAHIRPLQDLAKRGAALSA